MKFYIAQEITDNFVFIVWCFDQFCFREIQ